MLHKNVPIITLDGPSGTGKGTISHRLAKYLNWHVLDSGALYRVLAYAAGKARKALNDIDALVLLAENLSLRFELDEALNSRVLLDDIDIQSEIRSETCGQQASMIAIEPRIREALLARQRAFATMPGLVTDGRDMGTVVFPDALLKIFLYATSEVRAQRRYSQLKESGNSVSLLQVVDELAKRDARDMSRTHAPLKAATDAVLIDTTGLSVEQVFDKVLLLVNEKWPTHG